MEVFSDNWLIKLCFYCYNIQRFDFFFGLKFCFVFSVVNTVNGKEGYETEIQRGK